MCGCRTRKGTTPLRPRQGTTHERAHQLSPEGSRRGNLQEQGDTGKVEENKQSKKKKRTTASKQGNCRQGLELLEAPVKNRNPLQKRTAETKHIRECSKDNTSEVQGHEKDRQPRKQIMKHTPTYTTPDKMSTELVRPST
jgi:hypothetical protein